MDESPTQIQAFLATMSSMPADAPTACQGWTAHEVAAHLAAGIEEVAELIEDTVNDAAPRPTRGFEEREAPYRAMSDGEVRGALAGLTRRASAAVAAQARKGVTVEFFDRSWTADELAVHTGNEFALHRWDLVGDDELGDALLSPMPVTESALKTLNTLPMLEEAPTARAKRGGLTAARLVLRCPDQPDIAFEVDANGSAHLDMGGDQPLSGDIVVTTDPVNRLLTMWGRRSSERPVTVTGDPSLWPAVAATLWGDSAAWAPHANGPGDLYHDAR